MSDIEDTPADAATRWLAQFQSDDVTADQRREFAEWLAADPRHPRAYERAQQFWAKLDGLPPTEVRAFDALLSPLTSDPHAVRRSVPDGTSPRSVVWQRATGVALAASVAALCVFAMAQIWHLGATYRTGTGEQRTLTLSDGSTILLNTATALSVDMTSSARRLVLHEGEAFFTVAPDPQRPFEVAAGEGTIRALGTAFSVRTDGDHVVVTVSQHTVRVSGPSHAATNVPENGRVSYSAGKFGPVEAVDPERALAWRRHRLIFENQPLADVIRELNRYRQGWIVLRDESLQNLPVTAVFDVQKTDQALQTIEEILPVRTFALTDRLVWLSRASAR